MTKTTKKTKATHTTRPSAVKLETPKNKLAAEPTAGHNKVIRAESFELVDSEGNLYAGLTTVSGVFGPETVLWTRDHKGRLRLSLRASEREATLNIFGEREPADGDMEDCVPRVRVGYDGGISAIGPHITIYNGNEDERVSLSIDGDGAGVVEIDSPGGQSTCINETGLVVLDRYQELLAKYGAPKEGADPVEDPPPSARSTKTALHDVMAIDEHRIEDLVHQILQDASDTSAKALAALIQAAAYTDDFTCRDTIATYACDAAFKKTLIFSQICTQFCEDSAAEFPIRST